MRILFQGDSITDAGRSRENDDMLGFGYARFVEASLGFENPKSFEFINRGVSGNKIVDLYARLKKDVININPDVMSILIGVNDSAHNYAKEPSGVDTDKFYKIYDMLIEKIYEKLPDVKIIILEPFCLRGSGIEHRWEEIIADVKEKAIASKRIAEKYNLPFVKLQEGFEKLATLKDASYWLADGVHPTAKGHEYIKNEWIKAFKNM